MENGTFGVYYWKPGMTEVVKGNMIVSNGTKSQTRSSAAASSPTPQAKPKPASTRSRSIAFSEESFVEISATFTPLNSDGTMKLLDWDDKDFKIEDNR